MREIKFRAWDKFKQKMIYENFAVKCKPMNQVVSTIFLEPDETPNCERIYGETNDSESFEVMQYTGLKDKKGKEIYEGDIVIAEYRSLSKARGYKGEVKWDDERACFELGLYQSSGLKSFQEIEIIGNIFEHSHLLNGDRNEAK